MKELINVLKSVGLEEAVAKVKVTSISEAVARLMKDSSKEDIDAVIKVKINELARTMKNTGSFNVVCIAAGDKRDMNDWNKKKALEAYELDPVTAIEDGLVGIIDDVVTPLDNRETLGPEGQWENKHYGKPLKDDVKREMTFIELETDTIVRAFGNIDVEAHNKYTVFGKWEGVGKIMNIDSSPPAIPQGQVDDVFELVDETESDFKIDIGEVPDQNKGDFAVIKGSITKIIETSNGGSMLIIDGDDIASESLAVFVGPSSEINAIQNEDWISQGDEIYTVGRLGSYERDGNTSFNMNSIGLIKGEGLNLPASMMDELDSVMYGA